MPDDRLALLPFPFSLFSFRSSGSGGPATADGESLSPFFADPELARKSWETLSPQRVASDPRLQAYRGAACFALARFEKKIDAKKKCIVEGIKWVEQAVNKMPEDVEIRLLRFSIQSNLPPAAGYTKHQGQDKLFITQNISRIPDESRRREILNLLSP